MTGRGERHKRSKSNGGPVGAGTEYTREVRRRSSETYREGNARTRGEHRGQDLTGVGGNGVRTQVLTGFKHFCKHQCWSVALEVPSLGSSGDMCATATRTENFLRGFRLFHGGSGTDRNFFSLSPPLLCMWQIALPFWGGSGCEGCFPSTL